MVGDNGRALAASSGWPNPVFTSQAGVTMTLRGVHVVEPALAWATGQNGIAWRWTSGWSAIDTPIDALASITGAPDAGVWALGAGAYASTILWHP